MYCHNDSLFRNNIADKKENVKVLMLIS